MASQVYEEDLQKTLLLSFVQIILDSSIELSRPSHRVSISRPSHFGVERESEVGKLSLSL